MADHQSGPGLDDRSLATQPWVDRVCRDLLRWAVPRLVEALQPCGLRLVFLAGSAALGEAAGWATEPDGGLLLSDLDLGVVTRTAVPDSIRADLAEKLSHGSDWPAASPAVRGAAARGGADRGGTKAAWPFAIGYYEARSLGQQAPTLGLVDFSRHGLQLWGEGELLSRVHAPAEDRVPPWEALRLVGNRALELLLGSPPDQEGESGIVFQHALAKAMTGLWTARLVLEGRYRIGWTARSRLLPHDASDDPVGEGARAWSAFLQAPSADLVPEGAAGLPLYRRALAAFLDALPGRWTEDEELPEMAFTREPCGVRDRAILWKRSLAQVRSHCRENGGDAGCGYWLRSVMETTPHGRRMAGAVLYWRLGPEGLGSKDEGTVAQEWRTGTRTLLGRAIPSGPGCREHVLRVLGEEARCGIV
jgi:hypothetical protein